MNRKTAALVLAVGCLALFIVWWLRPGQQFRNFPPSARGPWVAFGDSLTEGYGASPGHSYPALLSRKLRVAITNLGRSGETSSDGLKRLEDVVQLQPRVVLLCFGGNDSLKGDSPELTFGNLGQMIDRLHGEGTFVVLIGIRSASVRDRNSGRFKTLAREREVLYVPDILKGLAFKPVFMSDAIHPNDAGYERIAERLDEALRPLLPKLTAP